MNNDQPTPNTPKPATAAEKPGFFTRIFTKMDSAMKAKADNAAKNSCCGGDKNDKGGKCC